MVNKVKGQELGSKQTVVTETAQSPDIADRRRFNDDSKHQYKEDMERQKREKTRESYERLKDHVSQNPVNHESPGYGKYDYYPSAYKNLKTSMNVDGHTVGWPSSTPDEKLTPLAAHMCPEKHD